MSNLKRHFRILICEYIPRELEKPVAQAIRHFPAVALTGPRRAGKTLLLRRLFPQASYFLLECKAGRTVTPAMAGPVQRLATAFKRKHGTAADVTMFLVHQEPKAGTPTQAVSPGVGY